MHDKNESEETINANDNNNGNNNNNSNDDKFKENEINQNETIENSENNKNKNIKKKKINQFFVKLDDMELESPKNENKITENIFNDSNNNVTDDNYSRCIRIVDIPKDITDYELAQICIPFGEIERLWFWQTNYMTSKNNSQKNPFKNKYGGATVVYKDATHAELAAVILNETEFKVCYFFLLHLFCFVLCFFTLTYVFLLASISNGNLCLLMCVFSSRICDSFYFCGQFSDLLIKLVSFQCVFLFFCIFFVERHVHQKKTESENENVPKNTEKTHTIDTNTQTKK